MPQESASSAGQTEPFASIGCTRQLEAVNNRPIGKQAVSLRDK